MRKRQKHSEHYKTGYQAETAVTDKRQSNTRHRQSARDAAHIDQRLKTDERRQTDNTQLTEHVPSVERRANSRADKSYQRKD